MTKTINMKKFTDEELQLMIEELQAGRMDVQTRINMIVYTEEILFASLDDALLDELLIMDEEELESFIEYRLLHADTYIDESFSKAQAQLLAKLYDLLFKTSTINAE